MNFRTSLSTLIVTGCLSFSCQDEVDTELQSVSELSADIKSQPSSNARLSDNTLVYDLSVTVSEFSGRFNDPIKEPGRQLNEYSGTLTLTAVDEVSIIARPVNPVSETLTENAVTYTGSYAFTTSDGETLEREARVLSRPEDTPLNPERALLQILDLPQAGDLVFTMFELSEDFSDLVGSIRRGIFSINQAGESVVLNYTGDFAQTGTPLACGAEALSQPSATAEVLIRPGDQFGLPSELLQTPGLARVEYFHVPERTVRQSAQRNIFLGAATGGDFTVTYQGPESSIVSDNFVLARLFDSAGKRIGSRALAVLIQDGQRIEIARRVRGQVQTVPLQFVDDDGFLRDFERFFSFMIDKEELTPQGGTLEFSFEAPCSDIFEVVLLADESRQDIGLVSVSANGGTAQTVDFDEFLTQSPSRALEPFFSDAESVALNLREGTNVITVTALDDQPVELVEVRINKAPVNVDHQP